MSPVRTFKRTKVVITLGPATDDPNIMDELILAGANVARVNFSHGSTDDQIRRVAQVRASAARVGRSVGILGDLSGPKIRIDRFVDGFIELVAGAPFTIDLSLAADAGTVSSVGCSYKALASDVEPGAILLLNDGLIVLEVVRVEGPRVLTRVISGGRLSNNKGLNRRGGGLSAGALTEKDRQDIPIAAKLAVDYLAVSFPRSVADIEEARALMRAAGGHARLMAKIERTEAITHLESIVTASDAVMVARGDLGIEVGDAALMGLQKQIIASARRHNKIVVTATQMMESMIDSPIPTRAEVSDVANAVLDGTDAVMTSAETASGKYPVETIEAMNRICIEAEKSQPVSLDQDFLNRVFQRVDQSIAMAALFTAFHLKVKAIASLTESGSTALWMSRLNCGVPIYALTAQTTTRYRCSLFRDTYPLVVKYVGDDREELLAEAERVLVENGVVQEGDLIVLTIGEPIGKPGGTNTMKIVRVGDRAKV